MSVTSLCNRKFVKENHMLTSCCSAYCTNTSPQWRDKSKSSQMEMKYKRFFNIDDLQIYARF